MKIVIAAFPFTTLVAAKRRPCVALAVCDTPGDFLVAFFTSVAPNPAWRCAVRIAPIHPQWQRTGLKTASAVRVNTLTTLHATVLSGAMGVLPDDVMVAIKSTLKAWLGL